MDYEKLNNYMLANRIVHKPETATHEDLQRLQVTVYKMPWSWSMRFDKTIFANKLHSLLEGPFNDVNSASNISLRFSEARDALAAMREVAKINFAILPQRFLDYATKREAKLLELRPNALTRWFHKRLPTMRALHVNY